MTVRNSESRSSLARRGKIVVACGGVVALLGLVFFFCFLHAYLGGGNPIASLASTFGIGPRAGYQRSLWIVVGGGALALGGILAIQAQIFAALGGALVALGGALVALAAALAALGRAVATRAWSCGVKLVHQIADPDRHVWALLLAAAGCIWLYGGFIVRTYAGADFPPAVSYALNFQLAFDHGQFLPRLVELAREFQVGMGSVDGTPPTADAPVFQYYGFLSSALAYPFLAFGVPGPEAVGCAILVAFLVGTAAAYATAIVLDASRGMALVASWSYLSSPWLISNIYGRGGIAEGIAHALLPVVLLGLARIWTGHLRSGIIVVAAGIAALALSHNIFLLYGILLCALVAGFGFLVSLWTERPRSASEAMRCCMVPASIAAGILLGLAVSIWQWAPAYITVQDTAFGKNVTVLTVPENFSSLSGIFGLPARYAHVGAATPFFFTIGWWTIPSVIAAVFFATGRNRRYAIVVAGVFFVFFLLCYVPSLIFPLLPKAFGATQVTFRLLAFLSLLGAFSLCLIKYRMPAAVVAISLLAMTASQVGVIYFPVPTFRYTEDQYLNGWEVNAFHSKSDFTEGDFRVDQPGSLAEKNTILLSRWREITNAGRGPIDLRIVGRPVEGIGDFELSVGGLEPGAERQPISRLDQASFDITVPLTSTSDRIRLYSSKYVGAIYSTFIQPTRMYLIEEPLASYVYADALERTYSHGLRRSFVVKPDRIAEFHPTASGRYVLEIPMVYSRFLVARQGGANLPTWCDFNYRLNVQVGDLSLPVEVEYLLPMWMWMVALAALTTLAGLASARLRAVAHRISGSMIGRNVRPHR